MSISEAQAIAAEAISKGWLKPPAIPKKPIPKRPSKYYLVDKARRQAQRSANIANGLRHDGKPRKNPTYLKLTGWTEQQKRARLTEQNRQWRLRSGK